MYKSLILSSGFHLFIIFFAMITLPFVAKKPLDIPPIVSIELIQITDETNIPYAPKAKKIIEKVKKEQEKLVSEQAPPKKIKKEIILTSKITEFNSLYNQHKFKEHGGISVLYKAYLTKQQENMKSTIEKMSKLKTQ